MRSASLRYFVDTTTNVLLILLLKWLIPRLEQRMMGGAGFLRKDFRVSNSIQSSNEQHARLDIEEVLVTPRRNYICFEQFNRFVH